MAYGNLYIMCGIPGCGKSTWAKIFLPNATIVSSDTIRQAFCGDENDQSRNKEVFEYFHNQIRQTLELGHDVVADATHLTESSRNETRHDARKVPGYGGDRVHLVVFTNVAQAILRNEIRERRVPSDVMYRMLANYERTLTEVNAGGPYDSVIRISDFSGAV